MTNYEQKLIQNNACFDQQGYPFYNNLAQRNTKLESFSQPNNHNMDYDKNNMNYSWNEMNFQHYSDINNEINYQNYSNVNNEVSFQNYPDVNNEISISNQNPGMSISKYEPVSYQNSTQTSEKNIEGYKNKNEETSKRNNLINDLDISKKSKELVDDDMLKELEEFRKTNTFSESNIKSVPSKGEV